MQIYSSNRARKAGRMAYSHLISAIALYAQSQNRDTFQPFQGGTALSFKVILEWVDIIPTVWRILFLKNSHL